MGSQKISLITSKGFFPIRENKTPPKIIVKITAITGALTSRKFDRFFLVQFLAFKIIHSIEFDISIPNLLGFNSFVISGQDNCPPTNAQNTSEISNSSSKS